MIKTRKKKRNVLEWEQERAVCRGGDLNQSNIYHRKVEKTYIIVSTCMINFRIESSYIFVLTHKEYKVVSVRITLKSF